MGKAVYQCFVDMLNKYGLSTVLFEVLNDFSEQLVGAYGIIR